MSGVVLSRRPAATRTSLPPACRVRPSLVVVNRAGAGLCKALGQRAKTDPIDARVIAALPKHKPMVRHCRTRRAAAGGLLARRRQIVEMMASESQRLRRSDDAARAQELERLLVALKRELADIDHDIDDTVRGSPVWREKEDCWLRFPASARSSPRHGCRCRTWHLGASRSVPWLGGCPSFASPAVEGPRSHRRRSTTVRQPVPRGSGRKRHNLSSRSSTSASSPPANPRWPQRSLSLTSSSSSSTHPAGQKAMASRLTGDTVAEERPTGASRRMGTSRDVATFETHAAARSSG